MDSGFKDLAGRLRGVTRGDRRQRMKAACDVATCDDGSRQILQEFDDIADHLNQALQLQNLHDGVVANATDAIISKTLPGIITGWSPAATEIFGYPEVEMIGQSIVTLIPEDRRGDEREILAKVCRGERIKNYHTMRRRKNGESFPISMTVFPILDTAGAIIGACEIARDVTEAVKAAEALKRAEERYELVLKGDITHRTQLQRELEQTVEKLEKTTKDMDEFAYAASHDLKAPLRVIDNASQWLMEDLEPWLTAETRENMALLRSRVKRMEKLLGDLLEYSRIGKSGGEQFAEPVKGSEMLENIVLMLAPKAGFTVQADDGFADIKVPRMPLQQVLMNLIDNAIKHHDKKEGRVEVTMQDAEAMYRISVSDDGPGIPVQFHDKVFDIFRTLKPRDQVEGSGMGLAMARKHVEMFGGAITLQSSPGRGCTFRFTWPKAQQARTLDA